MKIQSLRGAKHLSLVMLALLGLLTTIQVGCSMSGSEDTGVTEDGAGRCGYGYGHCYGHKGK